MKRSLIEEVEIDLTDLEVWRWIKDGEEFSHVDRQYEILYQIGAGKAYLKGMEKLFTVEDAQRLYKFIKKQIEDHEIFKAEQQLRRKKERLRRLFPEAELDIEGIAPPIKKDDDSAINATYGGGYSGGFSSTGVKITGSF